MDRGAARQVLSRIPYGIYVVGAREAGRPVTMIATWMTQVSFFPQLIALSVERDAHMRNCIAGSGYFSLNLLPAGSKGLAAAFLKPVESKGTTVGGHEYIEAPNGSPFLREASACIECRVTQRIPAGDHEIIVGEVVEARREKEGEVLTMRETGWNYQK
jgi:3-hydroxy-9,10-secoandrosta-1,3,5(10)-triene-9,17-dione monooxygenase reductase component